MKTFTSMTLIPASLARRSLALALFVVLSFSSLAFGAQNPPPKKKTPILTTDDIMRPKSDQTVEEGGEKAEKTESEKGEKAVGKAGDKTKGEASPQAGKGKDDPEEASWREKVKQARDRAKETERVAEETELRVTELRNQLGASGTAQGRNETAAELDETGKRLIELRADARAAKADLEKLLEYGREKGFAEAPGPSSTTDDGKPNEDYYRSRYQKLREELRTTERRVDLYENRVRDLNQRIRASSVTGDNFYIAQLSQDRDEAQQKLDEAREARNKAQSDIDALLDEARRAGIQPGVFR